MTDHPFKQIILKLCFGLSAVIICVLSLIPAQSTQDSLSHIDKVEHLAAYMLLTIIAAVSFPIRHHIRVFACLVLLGITLEFLQSFVPSRQPDVLDVLFNCIGIAMGAFAGRKLLHHWAFFSGSTCKKP